MHRPAVIYLSAIIVLLLALRFWLIPGSTPLQNHVSQMFLLHFIITGGLAYLTWRWTSKLPNAAGMDLLKILLRSLAVSIAIAPTVVVAGWIGIPAPAAPVLIGYLIAGDPQANRAWNGIEVSSASLLIVWVLTSVIYLLGLTLQNSRSMSDDGQPER